MESKYGVYNLPEYSAFGVYRKRGEKYFMETVVNHKKNAELIAKILNDDENGVSSVYKAWKQYRGVDVL